MIQTYSNSKSFQEDLTNFCFANKNNQLINLDLFQISNISPAEIYRAFIDYDFKDYVTKDLVISHLESIQSYSPVVIFYLLHFLELALSNKLNFEITEIDAKKITKAPKLNSTKDIISGFFLNSSVLDSKAALKIFENNGFVSKFNIKNSNSNAVACVFDNSYQMSGKLEKFISETVSSGEEYIYDCKLVVYDGFIQEISELNKILTFSNQDKSSFLIICRGASEDVGYTCSINKKMRKANVNIFIPEPEFWKDNSYDFCVATKSFKFGFETGTLLSMVDKDNLFTCEAFIKQEGLFLKNNQLGINQEALTTLYIPDTLDSRLGIFEDQLNFFRSLTQQIALCGLVDNKSFFKKFNIDLSDLVGVESNFHPAFPVFRAFKEAKIIASKILNIGCLIKKSNDG